MRGLWSCLVMDLVVNTMVVNVGLVMGLAGSEPFEKFECFRVSIDGNDLLGVVLVLLDNLACVVGRQRQDVLLFVYVVMVLSVGPDSMLCMVQVTWRKIPQNYELI